MRRFRDILTFIAFGPIWLSLLLIVGLTMSVVCHPRLDTRLLSSPTLETKLVGAGRVSDASLFQMLPLPVLSSSTGLRWAGIRRTAGGHRLISRTKRRFRFRRMMTASNSSLIQSPSNTRWTRWCSEHISICEHRNRNIGVHPTWGTRGFVGCRTSCLGQDWSIRGPPRSLTRNSTATETK